MKQHWKVETPNDDLLDFGSRALGAPPPIKVWRDSSAGDGFYHTVAHVDTLDNAYLIAASPALYNALEFALEYLEANPDEYSNPRAEQARAALAAARSA